MFHTNYKIGILNSIIPPWLKFRSISVLVPAGFCQFCEGGKNIVRLEIKYRIFNIHRNRKCRDVNLIVIYLESFSGHEAHDMHCVLIGQRLDLGFIWAS